MLIGICGKKGVGKDTVADFLVKEYGFSKDAFAAPIKAACAEIFAIPLEVFHDQEQKETVDPFWERSPRQLLQEVGTDLFRQHMDSTIWVRSLERRYTRALEQYGPDHRVCVSDVRFLNEAQCILDRGGKLLYIDRPEAPQGDHHASETSVDEVRRMPNIGILLNDGTVEDLLDKTRAFLRTEGLPLNPPGRALYRVRVYRITRYAYQWAARWFHRLTFLHVFFQSSFYR